MHGRSLKRAGTLAAAYAMRELSAYLADSHARRVGVAVPVMLESCGTGKRCASGVQSGLVRSSKPIGGGILGDRGRNSSCPCPTSTCGDAGIYAVGASDASGAATSDVYSDEGDEDCGVSL